MNVCLITDRPDHPVLGEFVERLACRHQVSVVDASPGSSSDNGAWATADGAADIYLLKAHTAGALALARKLEESGCRVVNGARATAACQDRVLMAGTLKAAGIPAPPLLAHGTVASVCQTFEDWTRYPLMVKSRISRRGDLVMVARSLSELQALKSEWAQEPVVVQEYIHNSGWDVKLFAVGGRIFAGRRRTPLDPDADRDTIALDVTDLPSSWMDAIVAVGKAFGLDLYGVDLVTTDHHAVVVDVNAFPGYRGIAGVPGALADWVDGMAPVPTRAEAPRSVQRPPLYVTTVRRKPGRGLVLIGHKHQSRPLRGAAAIAMSRYASAGEPAVSALGTATALSSLVDILDGAPAAFAPALLAATSAHSYPDDPGLPGLASAVDPHPEGELWRALERAALSISARVGGKLVAAAAEPVRYKPGGRCLVRYRLELSGDGPGAACHEVDIYGKVFRGADEAENLDAVLCLLSTIGEVRQAWSVPASLGVLRGLGLALTTDAAPSAGAAGLEALRPARVRTPQGRRATWYIPGYVLDAVGRGLARLHQASVDTAALPCRGPGAEIDRARQRSAQLADLYPEQVARLAGVAEDLIAALSGQEATPIRFCHGGFKPSQLLIDAHGCVVVTDWDGACAADPALDLGYFLAYLRPPSLWRDAPGSRAWFEAARLRFLSAYYAAARKGDDGDDLYPRERRAAVYEAALLLKIATRRVNRLNAPRGPEFAATLAELQRCLRSAATGSPT
jgi:glutathione synthase/RimK-type ligase-like ATP-grasp enzyme